MDFRLDDPDISFGQPIRIGGDELNQLRQFVLSEGGSRTKDALLEHTLLPCHRPRWRVPEVELTELQVLILKLLPISSEDLGVEKAELAEQVSRLFLNGRSGEDQSTLNP